MGAFGSIGGALVSGGFDLLGKGIQAWTSHNQSKQEYARQKEFATHGIRWKVADAKAAGIHPIYAIGANTPTYSPQAAIGTDLGLSDIGQNIGRAIEAKQTRQERAEAQEIANNIGNATADYYRAAADNQRAQADLAGQRSVTEALQDIRHDVISDMAVSSERQVRTQQQQPPMSYASDKTINSYENARPGIVLYRVGDNYFEFPPEDVADIMESPKMMAAWKAGVESAYYLDGKVSKHVIQKLSPEHIKGIKSGYLDIMRIPGIGVRVVTKEQKKNPAPKVAKNLLRHIGGPYSIQ